MDKFGSGIRVSRIRNIAKKTKKLKCIFPFLSGHFEQGRASQQLLLLQPAGVLRGRGDHRLLNHTEPLALCQTKPLALCQTKPGLQSQPLIHVSICKELTFHAFFSSFLCM
jgi:hypothetical protein